MQPLPLKSGMRVEGYFTVRGGDDDIIFYIEDPREIIIYKPGGTGRIYKYSE